MSAATRGRCFIQDHTWAAGTSQLLPAAPGEERARTHESRLSSSSWGTRGTSARIDLTGSEPGPPPALPAEPPTPPDWTEPDTHTPVRAELVWSCLPQVCIQLVPCPSSGGRQVDSKRETFSPRCRWLLTGWNPCVKAAQTRSKTDIFLFYARAFPPFTHSQQRLNARASCRGWTVRRASSCWSGGSDPPLDEMPPCPSHTGSSCSCSGSASSPRSVPRLLCVTAVCSFRLKLKKKEWRCLNNFLRVLSVSLCLFISCVYGSIWPQYSSSVPQWLNRNHMLLDFCLFQWMFLLGRLYLCCWWTIWLPHLWMSNLLLSVKQLKQQQHLHIVGDFALQLHFLCSSSFSLSNGVKTLIIDSLSRSSLVNF